MIEINDALSIINEHLPEREKINIKIEDALDYVSAESIFTPEPLPRFTNSAMDGFAVKWQDIKDLTPGETIQIFRLIGESAAGFPFTKNIPNNKAIRINTGAMLPEDVDTVIPIEDIMEKNDTITISKTTFQGANIRYKGEEIVKGDIILKSGKRITIPVIALLSSVGIDNISVYKKPNIALIVTGSELVQNGDKPKAGQIRNSNFIMLKIAIDYAGGVLVFQKNTNDLLQDIKQAIYKASEKADIILVSGGVSVGPHDLVRQAAAENGFEQLFWKIKQKPGKPMYFAKKENQLLFGLPGNPVSSLNSFSYYIFPVIHNLRGLKFKWNKIKGIMANDIINKSNRSTFYRVKIENNGETNIIKVLEKQGSHLMEYMSRANGFIIVKPGQMYYTDETAEVNLYPWEFL